MTGWMETHRSFVNTWECDENAHLNVQFYLKRFDEVSRILSALASPGMAALPESRHVRFHSELRPGTMTRILSAVVADGPYSGWMVHNLENCSTGGTAATAIDPPPGAVDLPFVESSAIGHALPRGLPAEDLRPFGPDLVLRKNGLVANRSVVQPGECDGEGHLLQQFYVSRFTDAAPHVWQSVGIDEPWLTSRGWGRVAVEMKISHHQPARAGDVLYLYSCAGRSGKTIRIRHEVVRQPDMAAAASAEVLALIMDLQTRKSVALPGDLREWSTDT